MDVYSDLNKLGYLTQVLVILSLVIVHLADLVHSQ